MAQSANPFGAEADIFEETFARPSGELIDISEKLMSGQREPAPEKFIDALVLGDEKAIPEGFLEEPRPFLFGEFYKERDRNNTQPGDWNNCSLSWAQVAEGMPRKGGAQAWGLCRHPQAKKKQGSVIVFGGSVGGERKAKAMTEVSALALDIDSGAKLEVVKKKIIELGLMAFVYSSFNHRKNGIELKRDDVLNKLGIDRDPSAEEVRQYLRLYSRDRYEDDFLAEIGIEEQARQTSEGRKIVLSTPTIDKFRVVFPLAEVVKLSELADRDAEVASIFEDTITGLARNVLDVYFDVSCTDASRMYYLPRHPKGADHVAYFIQGRPISFDEVPRMSKAEYTGKKREVRQFKTPSGKDLRSWYRKTKDRFEMADLLEHMCSDKTSPASGPGITTTCPFEHEHSDEGGSATMAINSQDGNEDCWSWFCHHHACQGRDKLHFVEEALNQGWFDEDLLWDLDAGFLLEPADGAGETEVAESLGPIQIKRPSDLDEVFDLTEDSSDEDIRVFFARVIKGGIRAKGRERMLKLCADNKVLGKREAGKVFDEVAAVVAADERAAERELRRAERAHVAKDFVPTDRATAADIERAAETAGYLPDEFYVERGWFYHDGKTTTRVCRVLDVAYIAYADETMRITVRFPHRSAALGIREFAFTPSEAMNDSIVGTLMDRGLEVDPDGVKHLLKLLMSLNTENEALLAAHAGWNEDRTVFVCPTGEVVGISDDQYVLNPDRKVNDATQGDLEMHHKAASAALLGDNGKYLLPGYLTAGVGCLTDFLQEEFSPILSNVGKSTVGKSSSLKAGAAWFAKPDSTGLVFSADATATAVENLAIRGYGTVVALDEGGANRDDVRNKQRQLLQWGDGTGRSRGTKDGGIQDVKSWRTCFATSSEVSFLREMEMSEADTVTGAVARVLVVNLDDVRKYERPADGDVLDAYDVLTNKNGKGVYGIAGPIFAQRLAEMGVDAVREMVDEAVADWSHLAKGAGARVVRAAALFKVAGLISQKVGLFSEDVPVHDYIDAVLTDSIESRIEHLDTEAQSLVKLRRLVRAAIQRGEIVDLHQPDEYRRGEILGYWGVTADNGALADPKKKPVSEACEGTYYLPLDRLAKLGVTTDEKALIGRLKEAGALVMRKKGDRQDAKWHVIPHTSEGNTPHIRVTGEFIHGSGDEDDQ
ncbi:DUF927 domain-containing protein [Leisingera daeponensis]|uniref:DUF927 domain-containing protein n=1 Tax=Leisingera daeponensis TaxID=405746 RepID=UPI001C9725EB|nr:DUF927 domain-containing protein [Leisingera daeponensis]MBY6056818.1 DUF927 domain-containing protein [Leisingera daeponensis]